MAVKAADMKFCVIYLNTYYRYKQLIAAEAEEASFEMKYDRLSTRNIVCTNNQPN